MALLPRSMLLRSALNCYKNSEFYVTRRSLISKQLVYSQFGDPVNVVKFRETQVPKLKPNEVLVRMLAAPVNPADINTIQGKGPIKPCLPTVAGSEGVGEIVELGEKVSRRQLGQRVLINRKLLGSWRYYGIYDEHFVIPTAQNLPLNEAATLATSPCIAYRMLKDYIKLKPRSCVIQTAANSPVGQYVIQLCRLWGIQTINLLSTPGDDKAMKEHLYKLGATQVCTLQEAEEIQFFNTSIQRPILGINSLDGLDLDMILKALAPNGVVVNYGTASLLPCLKENWRLDAQFCRFDLNEWDEKIAAAHDRLAMLDELSKHMVIGEIVAPSHEVVEIRNYRLALENTAKQDARSTKTYVFDFTVP